MHVLHVISSPVVTANVPVVQVGRHGERVSSVRLLQTPLQLHTGCQISAGSALIGASLLVAFGLLYVQPYIDIRHLVESECMTEEPTVVVGEATCTCASDGSASCMSRYPCIHIFVNYTLESDDVVHNATLYDSYETYILQRTAQQVNCLSSTIVTFFLNS